RARMATISVGRGMHLFYEFHGVNGATQAITTHHSLHQYLNWATDARRSAAIFARSTAADLVLLAPCVVLRAAWATPVMFWAIPLLTWAASATLRLISLVVAVCSSTALAIVFCRALIWWMILAI